ncbi:aminomethyl-transferring glycine dehydrogenase subunit GcvPB [Candidatus Sumerlaeota bacterium]|nr:aminomethyl-transferring glycine dehydrogenase subunit GcvPB [Candidatus Sumerlaeota bacterium]
MDLIFESSSPGRQGVRLPDLIAGDPDPLQWLPAEAVRSDAAPLPEVSEPEVVRHFTRLSQQNFSIDTHFYPLGSCTMKYNPRLCESAARLDGFAHLHPLQDASDTQGILSLMAALEDWLCAICGMDAFTLNPAAGAHGEFCGMSIIQAYHVRREGKPRPYVLIPESAHGTNPASATLTGMTVKPIRALPDGTTDVEDLERHLDDRVAGMMLTNPNTVGVFETNVCEIARKVHAVGGLMYYDGANLNAIAGVVRPGDPPEAGFDVVHVNLHKTFSTPHGGGGPGSGPVGVKSHLEPFLPIPRLVRDETGRLSLTEDRPLSIGRLSAFQGNVGVIVRAFAYILLHGLGGLRRNSHLAVLSANYLRARLRDHFEAPFTQYCMHEFIISLSNIARETGVKAGDFAKRLLDYGFHAPTVYFPTIVPECMLIEPTETESRQTLDAFADALIAIKAEAQTDPDKVRGAPWTLPVSRLDEYRAATQLDVSYSGSARQ